MICRAPNAVYGRPSPYSPSWGEGGALSPFHLRPGITPRLASGANRQDRSPPERSFGFSDLITQMSRAKTSIAEFG